MNKKYWLLSLATPLFLFACGSGNDVAKTAVSPQSVSAESAGAAIFTAKCAICHDLQKDKIGPALSGTVGRWNNDRERVKSFIKNSQEVIGRGDAYTATLYQKWHNAVMPAFPDLTDNELDQLVDYIK